MTFYFAMTNSWSLLYDELYGEDTMPEDKIDLTIGAGNTASAYTVGSIGDFEFENISINTAECPEGISVTNIPQSAHTEDTIHISTGESNKYIYESPDGGKTVTRRGINSDPLDKEVITGDYFGNDYPMAQTFLADNDDSVAHHFDFTMPEPESITLEIPEEFRVEIPSPTPGIESNNPRKYKEDEAIKALQDYISTTYGGHYTSKENNVQTLELIESVGDAESFCRSNAIKYLSRYDKKGQAKRDILKALHYSLLLYHFSGQLKETTTRGYETF